MIRTSAMVFGLAGGLASLAVVPSQVGGWLQTGLLFVVVVGVLVFVHELGHFLVAKRAGIGVLKFSLGFGPKVWGFKRGETEYLISAIPLGGYVKMVGEDPGDQAADPGKSFQKKPLGWRSLVVVAGPGSNVILALFFFSVHAYFVGVPVKAPVLGAVEAGSAAEKAGLRPGDRVLAIGGQPVEQWEDIPRRLEESKGQPMAFQLQRGSDRLELLVTPVLSSREKEGMPAKVTRVLPGSPAEKAGFKPGDKVLTYDGMPISTFEDLQRLVNKSPGRTASVTVERDGRQVDLQATPEAASEEKGSRKGGRLGIESDIIQEPVRVTREEWTLGIGQLADPIPIHRALILGAENTLGAGVITLTVLGRLVKGEISPKIIGGPLMIATETGRQAKQGGVLRVIWLTALLSVNLAILNLLPVPILDGGHLLFFAIEKMRGGPLSLRKREIAQQVGLALLVALMVFAFYNDIFRLLGRH